jgi:hypothetical protein
MPVMARAPGRAREGAQVPSDADVDSDAGACFGDERHHAVAARHRSVPEVRRPPHTVDVTSPSTNSVLPVT